MRRAGGSWDASRGGSRSRGRSWGWSEPATWACSASPDVQHPAHRFSAVLADPPPAQPPPPAEGVTPPPAGAPPASAAP